MVGTEIAFSPFQKGKGEVMMKSRVLSIDSYSNNVFLLFSSGILITGFILLLKV
jgi:hypothetical protein